MYEPVVLDHVDLAAGGQPGAGAAALPPRHQHPPAGRRLHDRASAGELCLEFARPAAGPPPAPQERHGKEAQTNTAQPGLAWC